MIFQHSQQSSLPSKLSQIKSEPSKFKIAKERETIEKSNNVSKRKIEIIEFSKELSRYKLSYSVLSSQKPKKRDERERAIEIATFVSRNLDVQAILQKEKPFPFETITEEFNVTKKFLMKNKPYLIAISLLLSGPYSEMKSYLLEGIA